METETSHGVLADDTCGPARCPCRPLFLVESYHLSHPSHTAL